MSNNRVIDAVVVGAGFAGMYMSLKLRKMGLSVQVYEAGAGVGGTWYWNRYPGARCDIESMEYSYQFSDELEQEWEWSERYAAQPEILTYLNHVADRFELRSNIQFETRVNSAIYNEETHLWKIATESDSGGHQTILARYCIMATGCLSSTNTPDFEGLDDFKGDTYHTGKWPHEGVDFTGKTVAVIGTGSSAIQSIPLIAAEASHLTVFQRTANYSIPAHNQPLTAEFVADTKANYKAIRKQNSGHAFAASFEPGDEMAAQASTEALQQGYQSRWDYGGLGFLTAFGDLVFDQDANNTAGEFVRNKIRDIVKNPDVAKLLSPHQTVGCKRLCVDTGYFETFNRANVQLVDVSEHVIETITEKGLVTQGKEYEVDVLVFATGFDAMTGSLLKIDIQGRAGLSLADKWQAGPKTYLGLGTAGFPNLFTISGPGSPSVLTNMVVSIEQHVNWISDCITYLAENDWAVIEATLDAENEWVSHVNDVANATIYPTCNSWYLGANVPGKPRVFMPYLGFPPYVEKCNQVAANQYQGFTLSR